MHANKWSVFSLALSVSSMVASYSVIHYLHQSGTWNPYSSFGQHLQQYYASAILISLILATIGIYRDRSAWMRAIAMGLSAFGLLVAITG